MKLLLTISAALESTIGLALLVAPLVLASALLGSTLETSVGLTIARVAGAALLALGIACWRGRDDAIGARALVVAMLFYNTATAGVLIHAGLILGVSAPGLWPTVVLHLAMAIWCIACRRPANQR